MSYPHGPGSGPAGGGPEWQPYSEPTIAGQPQFGQPNGNFQPGSPQYAQPGQGEAYQPYQQYPAQPGQWPGPGGTGPTPPRSRKPLIIGLVGGAAVIVVVLVVTLVVTLGGGGSASDPDAAVKTYLQALSDGDAEKALSVMKTPPSDLLLNDEILKKQQDIAKISDIKVVDTTKAGDMATVQATYTYGDRKADETFMLHETGDSWRLDDGAVAVELSSSVAVPQLTAFGVPVDQEAKIYFFPGPMEWGSADKNFTIVDSKAKDFPMSAQGYYSASQLTTDLSATGRRAVESAITSYLDNCALSKQADASADKPGCEQNAYAYDAEPGSATWTAPTDLSKLEYRVAYDNPEEVSVNGEVPWSVTYRTTATSYRPAENKSKQDTDFLYGDVDLSVDPPTFTPS